jgi:hypothetical protein
MGKSGNNLAANQKLEERKYLDQLIRIYPGFPQGRILSSESPDFLIYRTMRRITGIELTRFTRNTGYGHTGKDHFQPEFSIESLQTLIRKKEAKMTQYLSKGVEGIWLVILVDAFSHPSGFNIHNHLERMNPDTAFRAILVFDISLQKVYELKPPET